MQHRGRSGRQNEPAAEAIGEAMRQEGDLRGAPVPDTRPFVAPCRELSPGAPLAWLAAGWRDLRRVPGQSLSYGLLVLLLSAAVSFGAYRVGSYVLLLSVLSGFVFLGPVIAIGLYAISRRLEFGEAPDLDTFRRALRRSLGNAMVFALMLLVIFLVWARAGLMVHVFFPMSAQPRLVDLATYLGIGSAVGSIFAAVTFASSAFALPMLFDRDTDTVTAVVTSINAVLRNKLAMLVWASLIVLLVLLSFVAAGLGLVIVIPWLGHATWHAYRGTIDASAWPQLRGGP